MSHGIPYFAWRDGRPRWVPGPHLRARGYRGVDLKDEEGQWLTLADAKQKAMELNVNIETNSKTGDLPSPKPTIQKPPGSKADGYVYFVVSGSAIKIGFSAQGLRRIGELKVGLSRGIAGAAIVPGRHSQEQRLHYILRKYRRHGEWFENCTFVRTAMFRALAHGIKAAIKATERAAS